MESWKKNWKKEILITKKDFFTELDGTPLYRCSSCYQYALRRKQKECPTCKAKVKWDLRRN